MILSCSTNNEVDDNSNGHDILLKSIEVHDPNNNWESTEMYIHIQEPRIKNPLRYSEIQINISTGKFELLRNRENHVSKHTIDENGHSKIYLDDSDQIDEKYIDKYKLDPKRNWGYRDFYTTLIGLPMSLEDTSIKEFKVVETRSFNGADCYMVPIVLNKPLFSDLWNLYIDKSTFKFKGIEILFPDDTTKGERLFFDGAIIIDEMIIPRIRHWHEYSNNDYSGTDIIVKQLD